MFGENALTLIGILVIFHPLIKATPFVNWCNPESVKNAIPDVGKLAKSIDGNWTLNNKACYYHVKGADNASWIQFLDQYNTSHDRFSLQAARNVCRSFNGTLPTFRDKEEMESVSKFAIEWGRLRYLDLADVVMGMEKAPYNAVIEKWDDNVPVTFTPPWQMGSDYGSGTWTVLTVIEKKLVTRYHDDKPDSPILVFCKQNITVTGPKEPASTTSGQPQSPTSTPASTLKSTTPPITKPPPPRDSTTDDSSKRGISTPMAMFWSPNGALIIVLISAVVINKLT